jgi:hypothetical protein
MLYRNFVMFKGTRLIVTYIDKKRNHKLTII